MCKLVKSFQTFCRIKRRFRKVCCIKWSIVRPYGGPNQIMVTSMSHPNQYACIWMWRMIRKESMSTRSCNRMVLLELPIVIEKYVHAASSCTDVCEETGKNNYVDVCFIVVSHATVWSQSTRVCKPWTFVSSPQPYQRYLFA